MRVRGVDLAVRESGAGLPFVWGHGLLGSMGQEDTAGVLPEAELSGSLRLIRWDARGHGRSEASLDPGDYRWPELARDLLALADALGLERAALGGVSMGCATALHAAVLDPARVLALVLVGPPTAWSTRPRQARGYRFSASLVEVVGVTAFRCLGALASLRAGNPVLAAMQRALLQHLARSDRRAVAAALRGAAASDLPAPEDLRRLAAPALILAWRGDPVHPLSTARRLAELLPDAELHVARSPEEIRDWPEQVARFLAQRLSALARPLARPPR
jgi:3-oxoadipate enol-lactonase